MKFLQRSFMILIDLAIVCGCARTGAPEAQPSAPAQEAEPGAPAAASGWPGVPEPDCWLTEAGKPLRPRRRAWIRAGYMPCSPLSGPRTWTCTVYW